MATEQLNFRVSKEDKTKFENEAMRLNLSKIDLLKLKIFQADALETKIETIVETMRRELTQKLEVEFMEREENYEKQFKSMQEHFESQFKSWTNELFKAVVENIDNKLKISNKKNEDFFDERIENLFNKIDQKHYTNIIKKINGGE